MVGHGVFGRHPLPRRQPPQQRGDRGSRNTDVVYNDDGSVELYFGPDAPAGRESNWIQTLPDQHWFTYFRLYGPLEPYFDRSWRLDDVVASGSAES